MADAAPDPVSEPTPGPTPDPAADPARAYGARVMELLERVGRENDAALEEAAGLLVDRLARRGGLLYAAGAGHSLIPVNDAFYRAGGLAAVRPLYHPELYPLHGALPSTRAERRSGLAAEVLDAAGITGADVLMIFSTSGANPYPVELAALGRERGVPVVAVTSRAASAAAPARAGAALGRLVDQADIVLDTLIRPGDAGYPPEAPVTGALSTLANGYLWTLLLVRVYDRAVAAGLELPLWRSANVPGGDAANAALFAAYAPRVPELGADG
ncbi:sugar isomerase domain-containing protein [Allonocardiopsis opalescens]|uniref:Putative phosphosugar-binding protein n=1 Tax=Allonocardiopsis opalescens TaxID=1144618 RepID=A0A2T0PTE4_9ACTN|nr:sugar isomerase domain-containing protein [Allonocardiopsis opalescens]PRX92170.1 putative phosphosugar-binding protein [Allonocardiopsis opalescens]